MCAFALNGIKEQTADDLLSTEAATAFVAEFYAMMDDEIERAGFSAAERAFMQDPVLYYGRFLNPRTRAYFVETVVPAIGDSLLWLRDRKVGTILDLGCGLAMQSIMLAALGKRVVAIDLRPDSIELSRKRLRYYEEILGRKLDIEFVCGDFLQLDLMHYAGHIDGLFSMSAFSYIQPLEQTVEKVSQLCATDARICLFEENAQNLVARTLRRRPVPKPVRVVSEFERYGFAVESLAGTCALPKQVWRYPMANGLVRRVDSVLRRSHHLAFSYALQMQRTASASAS